MTGHPADEYKTRRRSERLFLTLPIRVSGTDPKGRDFSEDCISINVSRHGARIRLRNALTVDDVIHITNLKNGRAAPFRVVARVSEPQPDAEYIDWGVESLDPAAEIWGVELRDNPLEETAFSAVLQCNNCTVMSSFLLSHKEVGAIGASAFITRPCPRCERETVWTYVASDRRQVPVPSSDARRLAKEVAAKTQQERRAEEERRRDRRLSIQVPIRIRTPEGEEEISTTVDLGRTGLRFLGARTYSVGSLLFVTAPYRVGEVPIEMKALVESAEELPEGAPPREDKQAAVKHVGELPGSPKKLYGVRFESP